MKMFLFGRGRKVAGRVGPREDSRPIPALPRIGAMATMPSRADSLPAAIASVLPQIDRLYLYLDGFTGIPAIAADPKITVIRPPGERRLRSSGRFLALGAIATRSVLVILDDDISYPPTYVDALVEGLVRHDGKALVGFHAALFRPPYRSFLKDRQVLHFRHPLDEDRPVDLLGCGTMAFLSDTLFVDPRTWPEVGMDDVLVAVQARRHGIPRIGLRRPADFLVPIAENQPDSLWRQTKADDSRHSAYMKELAGAAAAASEHAGTELGRHGVDPEHPEEIAAKSELIG